MLARSDPDSARELLHLAEMDVLRRWRVYENRAAPGAEDLVEPSPALVRPGNTDS